MERCTRVSGKMTYNTEEALRHGPTKVAMKVIMHMAENTESEVTNGTTVASTVVTGVKTKSAAWVFTPG